MPQLSQKPAQLDHAWNEGDPYQWSITIAGEDLVADPVTTVINGTDEVFAVSTIGDTAVLTAPVLPRSNRGYRLEWQGRELVAGALYVAATGSPGRTTSTETTFTIDRGTNVVEVTAIIGPGVAAHVALTTTAHGGIVAGRNGVTGLWQGTEAEYAAIAVPDPTTVYVVLP